MFDGYTASMQNNCGATAEYALYLNPLRRWLASIRTDGRIIELGIVWGWDGESAVFAAEAKWALNLDELDTVVCIELLPGTDQADRQP